jgi:hypothetical protein
MFSLSVKSSSECSVCGGPYSRSLLEFSFPRCHLENIARRMNKIIITTQEIKPPVYFGPGVEVKHRGPTILPKQYPIKVTVNVLAGKS